MKSNINRRKAIKTMALGSSALAIPKIDLTNDSDLSEPLKGNINHSVCQWCFSNIPLENLAKEVKKLGLIGIDLIGEEGWATLKKYGLTSTMCYGDLKGKSTRDLTKGWCDTKYHEELIKHYKRFIPMVAEAGWTNLICFSGNSRGIDNQVGLQNCVNGLSQIIPLAEKYGVILNMELLNSKVDHDDYMCDNSEWGVALCKALGSNNFKLLYDIYHMQIMEGDVSEPREKAMPSPAFQRGGKREASREGEERRRRHVPAGEECTTSLLWSCVLSEDKRRALHRFSAIDSVDRFTRITCRRTFVFNFYASSNKAGGNDFCP